MNAEIVIYFNPLRKDSAETFPVAPGTALIDFLQEHYPVGFDGVLHVLVNGRPLDLSDLDYRIQEHERVIMLVMPGDAISAAWAAFSFAEFFVAALVSAVVGVAIGLIFRPDAPRGFRSEQESPVYSINATQNRARLGEPIPAHYGTVTWPPDFAAAPYVFYSESSSDMFVDELLCLGMGEFNVESIFIGETPVDQMEAGAVQYWLYGPDDHMQTLGTIEADIWSQVQNGPHPIRFIENMYTSPEVENWEFNDDRNDEVSSPASFAGSAFAAAGGALGKITGVDATLDIGAGDTITLANTVSNNVSFTVAFAAVDPSDDTKMTLFEGYGSSVLADEDPLPTGTTYTMNTTSTNMVAGPFRAQKFGQSIDQIDCDIIFPQGLMDITGGGSYVYREVEVEFTYQQIDPDDGTPIGSPIVQSKTYRAKTRKPLRDTVTSGPLTPGAYEVTVERITPYEDDGSPPDLEQTVWAGLKGHVVLDTETPAYGPVTILALRMKATNGLGQAARSRVRVTATRDLDSGDSDNIITVIKDIWLNTDYGMKRPEEELDIAALDALETDWDTEPSFNGSFDSRGTGFEAMQSVASLAAARVLHQNALLTVVPDRVQTVRTAMFSMANILPDSFELTYTFDTEGDFDGVRVEYRDPVTFNPAYVTYPAIAANPEAFSLFGCTSATYAAEFARYLDNTKKRRRKAVKFDTEMEGLIPLFGDRIGVSHSMPNWGQSGVVLEQLGSLTYRVDQALDWKGEDIIILRDNKGVPTAMLPVSVGVTRNIIVFDSAPPIGVQTPGFQEPTNYTFGQTYELIKDFMVTKITPQSERIVRIEGQLYDDEIYVGAPAHMGGV